MPKLVLRCTLAAFLLVASFVPYQPAVSAPVVAPPDPSGLVQALDAQSSGDLRVGYHRGTGQVNFLGSSAGSLVYQAPASAAAVSAETGAQQFLAAYGSLFGLTDPAKELSVLRDRTLDDGRAYVRYQQQYQGVPVFGGELMVGLDAARNVLSAGGELLPDIALSTAPALEAAAAQQIALDWTAGLYGLSTADLKASAPALWVYDPVLLRSDQRSQPRLVWRIEVSPVELSDIRELVLVDAQYGRIALHFNQVDTAMNRMTYTGNNTSSLPGPTLRCNQANIVCGGDAHAAAAHLHTSQTYDYYFNTHGRDSINGAGMTLISTVHHRVAYQNAFWNGAQMVYGDGESYPLADDVVAHELTHGVTQYESNLLYYYQSGAINESLSDIWGELVDQTNGTGIDTVGTKWLVGEDVLPGGELRDMEDPTTFFDPDMMTSSFYYEGDGNIGNNDNGGVHHNSGINNKAAFLLADGGTFNGHTVNALGLTKVAKLYYEVQTNLLVSGSDYLDLYNALIQGCANLVLYGVLAAGDCDEVQEAVDAVEMNLQPPVSTNPEAALCDVGGAVPVTYYANLFEGSLAGLTTGALSGTNRWSRTTGYAVSGTRNLYGVDSPAAVTDSFVALNPSITLPANAFLHFAHSYGFEDDAGGNYDGGKMEYSINNGVNWQNINTLPGGAIVNGYNGTIQAGFGNPFAGQAAFVGDSHGYISTRINLASQAGLPIRFRWRMGLDSIIFDLGWSIDNVHIYTCRTDLPAMPLKTFVPLVLP